MIDLLGKVGGFAGAIEFIVALILYIFTTNLAETKLLDIFINSLIDVNKNFEDLEKESSNLSQVKSISFQLKLFVYRNICCRS